jgi:DNA mismatch repair protein MutL
MGKILKMSPLHANMIAAGEVVERPSSVVKELVENAIDAKASSIKIYLKNGGLEEIRVSDYGVGMDRDDVLMAFIPHATSKIKSEYDLFRILTLGFRGEAIASIAAVSEMNIIAS